MKTVNFYRSFCCFSPFADEALAPIATKYTTHFQTSDILLLAVKRPNRSLRCFWWQKCHLVFILKKEPERVCAYLQISRKSERNVVVAQLLTSCDCRLIHSQPNTQAAAGSVREGNQKKQFCPRKKTTPPTPLHWRAMTPSTCYGRLLNCDAFYPFSLSSLPISIYK